jgi:hypothetical protein
LDVLAAVAAPPGTPALADLINGTHWSILLPGLTPAEVGAAVEILLGHDSVAVSRATKSGTKQVDVRAAVVSLRVDDSGADREAATGARADEATGERCAILTAVVRQTTPAVRPDDVLGALRIVADLSPPVPPTAVRLAQGLLDDHGCLTDPFDTAPGDHLEAAERARCAQRAETR